MKKKKEKEKEKKSTVEACEHLLTEVRIDIHSGLLGPSCEARLHDVQTVVEALILGIRRTDTDLLALLARLTKAVLAGA